ncbi:acyl-CoA synthetase [Aliigemmobacter aestuarii]|uniref:3-methylmercaptopropionyl-CoA ligase n=1 Tax=Aliigemmobacter aestuarii TaxID=1445661 RepID=A0A4S3MJ88_9RHOB|nr:AMP-binding protein [Gemmobacter aestuarii]THD81489.1 acyl-CoA synthetase [Gemmobacter aestuarii]
MGWLPDETGLERCAANYVPLSPLSHLNRAADIFGHRTALVWKGTRRSYAEHAARCRALASALAGRGVAPGDVVATLLPNVPAQAEAHFGVPGAGAILNTINTRLDVDTVAYIFGHAGAKIVLVDTAFLKLAEDAIKAMSGPAPQIIECADREAGFAPSGHYLEYEELLAEGDPARPFLMPEDEWESIAINYTSGTTGRPKGVVYHHRGAYLATTANVIGWRMQLFPVYLTIVPLFHCNGWCHTWMIPMMGGTLVCCRDITAKAIYDSIADEGVTHFGGAPIVLNTIINARAEDRRTFSHVIEVFTAGAPPPAATLAAFEPLGFNVTQVYGLTETYGPATECLWQTEWDAATGDDRAALKARTGVSMAMLEGAEVHDSQGQPVPRDAAHLGEIAMRGNLVMKGYYKNPQATREAFKGGWFRSGDIAFQHPDGYLKITDRAKDIIISGGENVSSVEVEGILMKHPAVLLCAVVAKPDDKWGEVPCAFVELKDGATATEADLIAHCRAHLAGFKTPKHIVFADLPKTSTGKIQKFELRAVAKLIGQ